MTDTEGYIVLRFSLLALYLAAGFFAVRFLLRSYTPAPKSPLHARGGKSWLSPAVLGSLSTHPDGRFGKRPLSTQDTSSTTYFRGFHPAY